MSDQFPRSLPAGWTVARLRDLVVPVKRALVGEPSNVLSISSARGFVPQAEKWARFMAGKSLAKYVELQRGEFAYNKGNSLTYPFGCIYRLRECDSAAVPFVYFCFRASSPLADPVFLDHYFRAGALNAQLSRLINAGVRNNGLLNVREAEFYNVQIPLPPVQEQRRICAMLRTVDDAIGAAEAVVEQLDRVRQDLATSTMRVAANGSRVGPIPTTWRVSSVGAECNTASGGTPDRSVPAFWGGSVPWVKTGEIDYADIVAAEECITPEGLEHSAAKVISRGAVVMAMYGQGATRGRCAVLAVDASLNQACLAMTPRGDLNGRFLYYYLWHLYPAIRSIGHEGTQKNLNASLVRSIPLVVPPLIEQQAIVAVLSAVVGRLDVERAVLAERLRLKATLADALLSGKLRVPAQNAA